MKVAHRVRSLLGEDGIVDAYPNGPPLAVPRTTDACALILQAANAEGWKVRIVGASTWSAPCTNADLALTTAGLDRISVVHASDLVATVEPGLTWERLRQALADQGTWVAADPPGTARTVGSVVATGTSGPLRAGLGGIRDHLLGLTLVTGDGRVLRPGGQVAKNVAGFDLTRLMVGSFGVFGIITSVNLRLRSVPRADATLILAGERDELLDRALRVLEAGESPAAMELLSPAAARRGSWILAIRLLGSEPAVEEGRRAVSGAAGAPDDLGPADAAQFWRSVAAGACQPPTTLRVGALPTSLPDVLDLIAHYLDTEWISVNVTVGSARWAGTTHTERIKLLRHAALQREFPVTLERAPWNILEAAGHYGAYREGVARLVASLRQTFDPHHVLVATPGAAE
jgi:glycolate oxidase FAD binding subunit